MTVPLTTRDDESEVVGFIDQLGDALEQLGNGYLRADHAHLYGVVLAKVKSARPENEFVAGLSEPQETALGGVYRPTAAEARAGLTVMRSALTDSAPDVAESHSVVPRLDPTFLRGRIFPNQFAASVSSSEKALAIRAALAASLPRDTASMIESDDEQRILDRVQHSSLEAWMARATGGSVKDWRAIDPTSSTVVTLRRSSAQSAVGDWQIEGRAYITVTPDHSLRPVGYGLLFLDVIFRPASDEVAPRPLALHELFELLLALLAALVDDVGPGEFDQLGPGANSAVLGAALMLQSYGLPLGASVELDKAGWSRVEGSRDRIGGEWEPSDYAELATPDGRGVALRAWLKRLLRDSGIRGHEKDVDAMQVP